MEVSKEKYNGVEAERVLVEAATCGDLSMIISLLETEISVDSDEHNRALFYASKNYMTPLQMACANGHTACAEFLIGKGADVNAKDRFDVTAMHMASEKGNIACLRALLNANAECSLPTKCSKKGCYTAVPYLGGTTPLHLAAANNHVECIQELIQYGADYNAVDELGRTSLYIAAQFGYGDSILAHLRNAVGRDILSLPSYETQDTPLHFAVSRNMLECVQALLASGSDVNHKNFAGYSPLHLAVNPSHDADVDKLDMLQMLVLDGYNTNINLTDGSDQTPLQYVCFGGRNAPRRRPEMAKFLMSYGADVNVKNNRGFTLLEYELKTANEESEILRYVVRSMLHPPHLEKLKVVPQLPSPLREYYSASPPTELMIYLSSVLLRRDPRQRTAMAPQEDMSPPLLPPIAPASFTDFKHVWYEKIASNPRTLQHYCRYTVRKSLGPFNMKYISTLPIPNALKSYLLLQTGD